MGTRILNLLLILLGALIAVIFVTGGGVWSSATPTPFKAKIELSSIDAWVALWALLLGCRMLLKEKSLEESRWKIFWNQASTWILDSEKAPKRAWVLLFLCTITLFTAHIARHLSLHTDAYDLSFLHQALFLPWQGLKPLQCDLCIGGSYLGEHLAFSLLSLAPLTRWITQDEWIFALQALLVAVPLVFALKNGPLSNKKSLWLLAIFIPLCERALRNSFVWDFREDHLGYAFAFCTLVSLWNGRIFFYFLSLIGWIAAKENFAFLALGLVLPIFFDPQLPYSSRARKILAGLTLLFCMTWIAFAFLIWIPHFSQGAERANQIVARFPGLGSSPKEVFVQLLTNPAQWIALFHHQVLSKTSLKYLLLLLGPFLGWIILGSRQGKKPWLWLAPALPGITMNVLSSAQTQRSLNFHYDLAILPFLIWSTWVSLQSLERLRFLPLLITFALSGSWPGRSLTKNWPTSESLAQSRYLRSIAKGTPVAASHIALAQLSQAPRIFEITEQQTEKDFRPARRLDETTRFVLDRAEPGHLALQTQLSLKGWKKISQSPEGRFSEWVQEVSLNP